MNLPSNIMEAARRAYLEGRWSEDRLDELVCPKRLKRFRRYLSSKRKRLAPEDKPVLAEYAAFHSIRPRDPELEDLARATIERWNAQPAYGGNFGFNDDMAADTASLVAHYCGSTGASDGHRHRTRSLRLSTSGLDSAAMHLKPFLPSEMKWATSSGGHFARDEEAYHRAPSKAERWLRIQLEKIEPDLVNDPEAAKNIIRAVIERTSRNDRNGV